MSGPSPEALAELERLRRLEQTVALAQAWRAAGQDKKRRYETARALEADLVELEGS